VCVGAGLADVEKRFGVPPRLVPDVQALAGDESDNCTACATSLVSV
jgi:5'-3' exonuclease